MDQTEPTATFDLGQVVYIQDHNSVYASSSGEVIGVIHPPTEDEPVLYRVQSIRGYFTEAQLTTDYVHNPWGGPCYNPAPVCHCGRERA